MKQMNSVFYILTFFMLLPLACSEENRNTQPSIDSGLGIPVGGGTGSTALPVESGGSGGTMSISAGSGGTEITSVGTDTTTGIASVGGQAGEGLSNPGLDAGAPDGNIPGSDSDGIELDGQAQIDAPIDASIDTGVVNGPCDVFEPPASVAAWVEETWNSDGARNIGSRRTWLFDAAMKGNGEINICVRYGATQAVTTTTRDQIAPAMQRWLNKWFGALGNYDCFPHPTVTVKVTGWAVKPGQESLLQWTDDTVPIYTDVSDGSDSAPGEPKCPDACGFFFHPDHDFTGCPGGEANHFDYSLWMNDAIPSGAGAEGGDWGVRIPIRSVFNNLNSDNFGTMLHEMGHGFGFPDYYTWSGSRPEGGSVMIIGSSFGGALTLGDEWMIRRFWKETKALRYP